MSSKVNTNQPFLNKYTRTLNEEQEANVLNAVPLTPAESALLTPSIKPIALHALALVGSIFYYIRIHFPTTSFFFETIIDNKVVYSPTEYKFFPLDDKRSDIAVGFLLVTFIAHAILFYKSTPQSYVASYCKKNMIEGEYTYFNANKFYFLCEKNKISQFDSLDDAINYRHDNRSRLTGFLNFEKIVK